MLYSVAIHQEGGKFVAVVPDLPNLEVVGDNMASVIGDIRLTIIEHLQNLVSNNQPIPAGQDIGIHLADSRFLGHTWAIVTLDSLRLSQHLVPMELAMPKSLLLSIYHELGHKLPNQAVGDDEVDKILQVSHEFIQNFILSAVKEKLTHSKKV